MLRDDLVLIFSHSDAVPTAVPAAEEGKEVMAPTVPIPPSEPTVKFQ